MKIAAHNALNQTKICIHQNIYNDIITCDIEFQPLLK